MKRIILTLPILALTPLVALAQPMLKHDPKRPTDKIAIALEIEESAFINCFENVSPDRDHNPSAARQRNNKQVLLRCLQNANSAITNDRLDWVMDKHRPEGPIQK